MPEQSAGSMECPPRRTTTPGQCDSGKLFGGFFSRQTLSGYLCKRYNQVGKLQLSDDYT
jgi:hypothetical protein